MGQRNVRMQRLRFRRPLLECLENRRVLAGNVAAVPIAGQLTLAGDDVGNEIMIRSGQVAGEVIVHGINTTLINGSSQDMTFYGIHGIVANLKGGDDWFKATDFTLDGTVYSYLSVDGGAGDDRIELKNTEVHVTYGAHVRIIGEYATPGMVTTGNDTIELANTTIIAEGGVYYHDVGVNIFGEINEGGQVTGGNDTITVTNTKISAVGSSYYKYVFLSIAGDYNSAGNGTSITTQGNDSISISNTTVMTTDAAWDDSSSYVSISGDINQVSSNGSIVSGGNDSISLTNTAISSTASTFYNFLGFSIVGDANYAAHSNASIASGGNDTISVDNCDVTASGMNYGGAALSIFGEFNNAYDGAVIKTEGQDAIEVKNSEILVGGYGYAVMAIYGEITYAPGGSVLTSGADKVVLRHVKVSGGYNQVYINTAAGDDTLDVQNSSFDHFFADLGDGDDEAKFLANVFQAAQLDGGLGYDVLSAHNNRGLLTYFNFEKQKVTS